MSRSKHTTVDHDRVHQLRVQGHTWAEVAEEIGHHDHRVLQSGHHKWRKRRQLDAGQATSGAREIADSSVPPDGAFNDFDAFTLALTEKEIAGIHTLEDLAFMFDVDLDTWEVADFWAQGNTWQQRAKGERPSNLHQYKIQARFRRRQEVVAPLLEAAFAEVIEYLDTFELEIPEVPAGSPLLHRPGKRYLAELALYDAHLGMLSWEKETGENYDLPIAYRDYVTTGKELVDTAAALYAPERYLYVVGHDLSHVDGVLEGKIPVTNRGTPQDLDSRLPKIFQRIVQAVMEVATYAAARAPVDIVIVRGNHDKSISFYIGEVLRYAFMGSERVTVRNEPRDLVFYNFGACTLGLTHGEKILRKQDNLVNIMADECPPEMWVASHRGLREIHTGHFHKRMQGGYYPRGDMDEHRGVVTRALAGLTASDAWHTEQGYRHRRAGTLLVLEHGGSLAGLHEHTP